MKKVCEEFCNFFLCLCDSVFNVCSTMGLAISAGYFLLPTKYAKKVDGWLGIADPKNMTGKLKEKIN